MGGDGGAHTAALPSEQVLRWVAGVVGGMRVLSVENPSRSTHRPSGTFRLRVEGTSTGATDLILKLSVPRWITDGMVITNARALRLAETHGLAGPRLIAADLDGRASGTVATLETYLSGSSDLPPLVSAARLREAGAAIARVNAIVLARLPLTTTSMSPRSVTSAKGAHACAADDRAADRRRGRTPTTPLLKQADERVRSHGVPAAASVFLPLLPAGLHQWLIELGIRLVEVPEHEYLDLEYMDWKSGGDTNFAPLASADGELDCRGFWDKGKTDKGALWTSNAALSPTGTTST